jgi:hypothetical protein
MSFFSAKTEDRRTVPVCRVGTSGRVEDIIEGDVSVNMVYMFCIRSCKWKNETCRISCRNARTLDKGE